MLGQGGWRWCSAAGGVRGEVGGPSDGSVVCAGVLVADTGGVLVPRRFVERSAGSEAGFAHLVAVEPLQVGQIP